MESTRQELLRKATATVRRAGSAALNFRDLGQSVGVKSSTVHYYFPTKSDLLNEAASEYTTAFAAALKDGARASKSFRQDMLVLVDLFVGAQGQELSCLCGMLATEADLLDPAVKTAVNGFFCEAAGVGESTRRTRVVSLRPEGCRPRRSPGCWCRCSKAPCCSAACRRTRPA